MSRTELADAVNTALDQLYPGRDLTAHYVDSRWIGKLERGEHRWPSDERRTALRHALGTATDTELGLYIPRHTADAVTPAGLKPKPSSGDWEERTVLLRQQWRLLVQTDRLFGPAAALLGVSAQLTLLQQVLDGGPVTFRPDLIRVAAQYAESAAWLHQSLDERDAAFHWTSRALGWSDQAQDPVMMAWARYRSSQHWLFAGDPHKAAKDAAAAMRLDAKLPGPMRAALRVQHAHTSAANGQHRAAERLLDGAHRWAADRHTSKPDGEHGSYCTSGYIEMYRGTCLRLAERPDAAIAVLDAALPSMSPLHRQDYTTALVNKAAAHIAAGQPDQAAATAHTALPIARNAGTRRTLNQLAHIGAAVRDYRNLNHVGAFLDDLKERA
ncbi:hypothetical protein [Dactylosporangium salmoneum]|uniref:XRE family transcriptional regulator n=1 Tax=Dactylosporangium salmoneum TaxID=53361 RepID=A0ABN3G172_9ACTN